MSLKNTRKGQSFESVGKGQTAVTRIPIGLGLERILVPFSSAKLSEFTAARLVANGETIRTWRDLTKLDTMNKFDGMAGQTDVVNDTSGIMVFNMVRHGLRTRAGEELTVIGTGKPFDPETNPNPISTLFLEIDISDTATAVPVLGVPKLHQSVPMATGAILKSKQYSYSPTGAGTFEIADLPKGELVNRIYFFSDKINSLEVERDNFIAFTRDKAENELLQSEGVRVPQAGLFVYDPTENGNGSEGLPTHNVHDLRFRLDMTGADTIEVVVETISLLQS